MALVDVDSWYVFIYALKYFFRVNFHNFSGSLNMSLVPALVMRYLLS